MRLNKFTDYSLRVLIYLTTHPDKLSTIQEIAQAYQISENHLMKVIHNLSKLGFIHSKRGKGGGIALASQPDALNLGEIIQKVEGDDPYVKCDGCCIVSHCQLPCIFEQGLAAFYGVLSQYTLRDVINQPELLGTQFYPPIENKVG
ncbi:Rrf2 family transcriptional regulator [Pasteurellaceae bacterium HPA106]|uniref:RrF2 family transcriptional regulator n=1 Tax=Spirabiliibacterium pneumoniae TaxID=221400 RepID=UPI001AAD04C2|nr:Rrf2 family transcriptional regulator [Spirabiliibacterium pneumoniae]MBE2895404.1 Rrf2 family transcriptional regulator [Spirabiliibacterium pneumoniae]